MKLFISSAVGGLERERDAVTDAARLLEHESLRSEELGAVSESSQRACLALVRRSDLVVLLLGERYGTTQPGGISATHEEYREARSLGKEVLVYIKESSTRDAAQREFVREVRDWQAGLGTADFNSAENLRELVIRDLKRYEVAQAGGSVDSEELMGRARRAVTDVRAFGNGPVLVVGLAAGPRAQVIRPAELASDAIQEDIEREALYGRPPVLKRGAAVVTDLQNGRLSLAQASRVVTVQTDGTVSVARSLGHRGFAGMGILHEDVESSVSEAIGFYSSVLDRFDATARLRHVGLHVQLGQLGHTGWRTRAEQDREPNRMTMNIRASGAVSAELSPSVQSRQVLLRSHREAAQDLAELLRQKAIAR